MLDLDQLKIDRIKASRDKVDLFDFYNAKWNFLVARIEELEAQNAELGRTIDDLTCHMQDLAERG